jgi:hypothetical protein
MDLEVSETGNGGDLVKKSRDLSLVGSFQNVPYLSMFGGNVEQSTPQRRNPGEQAFDWWGNTLLFPNNQSRQMNSETERTLSKVALTSSGRILIEQAVKSDLQFMKPYAKVSVSVMIVNVDRIAIAIKIVRPNDLEDQVFVWIWDNAVRELSQREVIRTGQVFTVDPGGIFDFSFDDSFE